jgi:hypothetical protein
MRYQATFVINTLAHSSGINLDSIDARIERIFVNRALIRREDWWLSSWQDRGLVVIAFPLSAHDHVVIEFESLSMRRPFPSLMCGTLISMVDLARHSPSADNYSPAVVSSAFGVNLSVDLSNVSVDRSIDTAVDIVQNISASSAFPGTLNSVVFRIDKMRPVSTHPRDFYRAVAKALLDEAAGFEPSVLPVTDTDTRKRRIMVD